MHSKETASFFKQNVEFKTTKKGNSKRISLKQRPTALHAEIKTLGAGSLPPTQKGMAAKNDA